MAKTDKQKRQGKSKSKSKRKIWEKDNPKKRSKKMTAGEKAAATKQARAHGRSSPSLVDNINAQKGAGKKKKKKKKKKKSR